MKRFISALLILILTTSVVFTGCNDNDSFTDSNKLKIVTSIFPYYDFAKNIAGDKAEIKLLLSPGSEPHDYEPTPSDIVAIEKCDIFIYNGGESDKWVDSVLETLENTDVIVLKMMDYVPLIESDSHHHDEAHSDDCDFDEHIWTSIRNSQVLCEKIKSAMMKQDTTNAELYKSNAENYISQLQSLDNDMIEIAENKKRDTIVFGDRFPMLYFFNDYGLNHKAAFPGCNSETEPSLEVVTELTNYVKDNSIPAVYYLEFSNGNTANLISEGTEAKALQVSSCHNVTKKDFESGVSYISLMENNISSFKEALQ